MDRQTSPKFLPLAAVSISTLFLLLVSGCCLFGGGKETPPPPKDAQQLGDLESELGTVEGTFEWAKDSEGLIKMTGSGKIPEDVDDDETGRLFAFRAAHADALEKLSEVIMGVQVKSATKVENYAVKEHMVELRVADIVKGAKEISREFDEKEKVATVEIGIFLEEPKPTQELAEIEEKLSSVTEDSKKLVSNDEQLRADISRLSKEISEIKNKLPDNEKLNAEIARLSEEVKKLGDSSQSAVGDDAEKLAYTGIVIDARGLGIMASWPEIKICCEGGDSSTVFYGAGDGRDRDKDVDCVSWKESLEEARSSYVARDWVTTPKIVKASYGSSRPETLVIAADDAKSLEEINKERQLLDDMKVIVLYGTSATGD